MKKGERVAIAERISDLVTGVNLYVGLIELLPPEKHEPLLEGILAIMTEFVQVADEIRVVK